MARIIQWATGSMGRTALRRVLDDPRHDLAGVYVYSDGKAGQDAGSLARRPDTGIVATNSIDAICALDADVVLHTPRITLPYSALVDDVVRLLESGKNVVSTAGFHWPAAHGADYARTLQDAGVRGGATLAGVGVNPGVIVERIALAATGMCHELDSLSIFEMVDASQMDSADFVFGLMGFNSDPEKRDIRTGPLAEEVPALLASRISIGALDREEAVRPSTAERFAKLPPAFAELAKAYTGPLEGQAIEHRHTVAHAPPMADGAGLALLASSGSARARILAYAEAGGDPRDSLLAGFDAIDRALSTVGLGLPDMDRIEFMEAFAVVAAHFLKSRPVDPAKVNVSGGHLAKGHPMGATGAILTSTLLDALDESGGRLGLVVATGAQGVGAAMIVERLA